MYHINRENRIIIKKVSSFKFTELINKIITRHGNNTTSYLQRKWRKI